MPFEVLKNAGVVSPEIRLFHRRAELRKQIAGANEDGAEQLRKQMNELGEIIALRLEALAHDARG